MRRLLTLIFVLTLASTVSAQIGPLEEGGTVWFFYPDEPPSPLGSPMVLHLGGITRQLAKIAPGEYFGYPVAPGVHSFSYTRAPGRGEFLSLSIKPGQQLYVEVHFRKLTLVSNPDGTEAVLRSRPITELGVIDKSVIVLGGSPAVRAPVVAGSFTVNQNQFLNPVQNQNQNIGGKPSPPPTLVLPAQPPATPRTRALPSQSGAALSTPARSPESAAIMPLTIQPVQTGSVPSTMARLPDSGVILPPMVQAVPGGTIPSTTVHMPDSAAVLLPTARPAPSGTIQSASTRLTDSAPVVLPTARPAQSGSIPSTPARPTESAAVPLMVPSAQSGTIPSTPARPTESAAVMPPTVPPAQKTTIPAPAPARPPQSVVVPPTPVQTSGAAATTSTRPQQKEAAPSTLVPPPLRVAAAPIVPPIQPRENVPAQTLVFSEAFVKATLNQWIDGRNRETEAVVTFDKDAVIVTNKKNRAVLKMFSYTKIRTAEYSYAKSPHWKTTIVANQTLPVTNDKRHWLLVASDNDFALVELDKSNYNQVLQAYEGRTNKKVEAVEDNK